MTRWLDKGIELISDVSGVGPEATRGSLVIYNARLCDGDRGDEGLIPPQAMLRIKLWVQSVRQGTG